MKSTSILLTVLALTMATRAQNWIQAPGIPADNVYSVTEHRGALFASTDSMIYFSSDAGSTWTPIQNQPVSSSTLTTLYSLNGVLYAGSYAHGIHRSDDMGQTWEDISAGLTGWGRNAVDFAVLGDSLYAGTQGDGVYVMDYTRPDSWHPFSHGLSQFGVAAIASSGRNLAVAAGMEVFVRPRSASAWNEVLIDSAAGQTPAVALCHFNGALFAGTPRGMYRGTEDGEDWIKVEIPFLANLPFHAFIVHGSRLYASAQFRNEHFLISSDDGGKNWEFRAHELALLRDLCISGGRMWSARSDGLWSIDLTGLTGIGDGGVTHAATLELQQNYPNPFGAASSAGSTATHIAFTLPQRADAALEVFDMTGRRVAIVRQGTLESGPHEVSFDGADLPSGLYMYRLRADRTAQSRTFAIQN
jgi:photosystem II stability/assembly factor-like uncharacterized protein